MALISKASLLMVPSTYEPGTLFNVLPSGNRAPDNKGGAGYDQTRADFDFDRGSNAAATRIGSDGLLKKYRENKLLRSNQFDTTWYAVNGSATLTSGQEGYDGSNDGWELERNAASVGIRQNISLSGVQTFSIYAKAGTLNWMAFESSGSYGYFDLVNGVAGTNTFGNVNFESIGNGWWRISVFDNLSNTRFIVYPAPSNGSLSGTSGNIYIQNAQLESGLVSTDVLTSGATTAKAGVLIDMPRINYDANGENGSLLLEPSRQQLIQYSEYFETSEWTTPNVVFETNKAISPDGGLNATKFRANSANSTHWASTAVTLTSGQDYTFKLYVKSAEYDWVQISLFGQGWVGSSKIINFNASTGEFGTTDTGITFDSNPMGNGWHEVFITNEAASTSGTIRVYPMPSDNATSYQGNGTSGIYIFGAQLEAGSYSSSYIPNHSGTGGVTRAADSCSVTGASDVIGQTEGTLFAEAKIEGLKDSNTIATLHNGSFSEYLVIAGNNSGNINAYIFAGGVQQAGIFAGTYAVDSVVKCAMAYKENDVAFYINGVLIGTDSSATMASTSVFDIGSISFGNYPLHGSIKQAILFNERLTNAELATLTTL